MNKALYRKLTYTELYTKLYILCFVCKVFVKCFIHTHCRRLCKNIHSNTFCFWLFNFCIYTYIYIYICIYIYIYIYILLGGCIRIRQMPICSCSCKIWFVLVPWLPNNMSNHDGKWVLFVKIMHVSWPSFLFSHYESNWLLQCKKSNLTKTRNSTNILHFTDDLDHYSELEKNFKETQNYH